MKTGNKEVGNINVSGRLKQIVILVIAIIIGMIISMGSAEAKDYQRENQKRNKITYKKQNNQLSNACHILSQKRSVSTNKIVKESNKTKFR